MKTQETAIFPQDLAPFRSLGLIITVMCYLACLALGGLLLAQRATSVWINDVGSEATILVRSLDGDDIDSEVAKAVEVAKAIRGVKTVSLLDKTSAAKLLEPWLGKDVATGLPLPRLISLQIDADVKPDYAALERELKSNVKGASLDTHQRWQAEFANLGRGLILLSAIVLALITFATATLVAFTARSVIQANASIVEILQLVGAQPAFIARANDTQFLKIGILSSALGLGLGLASFAILGFLSTQGQTGLSAIGNTLLFGPSYIWETLALMVLIPIVATLLALWTARFTLLRVLANPQ